MYLYKYISVAIVVQNFCCPGPAARLGSNRIMGKRKTPEEALVKYENDEKVRSRRAENINALRLSTPAMIQSSWTCCSTKCLALSVKRQGVTRQHQPRNVRALTIWSGMHNTVNRKIRLRSY